MIVNCSKKIVVLGNQKCGSTSLMKMLLPKSDIYMNRHTSLKHMNYLEYCAFIKPMLNNYGVSGINVCAVVREPINRLFSWYCYRQRDALKSKKHPHHNRSTHNLTFNQFIKKFLNQAVNGKSLAIKSQFDFVKNESNQIGPNVLYKYKNLHLFIEYLSDTFGHKLELPHLNKSPKKIMNLESKIQVSLEQYLTQDYMVYNAAL